MVLLRCQWSDLRTNRLDNNLTDHAFRGTHWSWKSPTSLKTLSPGVCAMQPAESDLLWLLDKTTARDHMSDTQHNSVERIVGKIPPWAIGIGLFVSGGIFLGIARILQEHPTISDLLARFGEAFIIASLLAALVE